MGNARLYQGPPTRSQVHALPSSKSGCSPPAGNLKKNSTANLVCMQSNTFAQRCTMRAMALSSSSFADLPRRCLSCQMLKPDPLTVACCVSRPQHMGCASSLMHLLELLGHVPPELRLYHNCLMASRAHPGNLTEPLFFSQLTTDMAKGPIARRGVHRGPSPSPTPEAHGSSLSHCFEEPRPTGLFMPEPYAPPAWDAPSPSRLRVSIRIGWPAGGGLEVAPLLESMLVARTVSA